MTVPETPSPEVLLLQQQQAAALATKGKAGPGRHVSDTTPSKGRLAKAQRTDDASSGGELTLSAPLCLHNAGLPSHSARCELQLQTALSSAEQTLPPVLTCSSHNSSPSSSSLSLPPHPAPAAAALYEGRGTYSDVITYAERLFGRIRQAVACQAAPTTLKAAFLDPVADSLATEVSLELFAKADADFMQMFTGESPLCIRMGGCWVAHIVLPCGWLD